MNETVAAVVVTYNRKDLLVKCLEGVLGQTHPVDRIYIIDNASTDGTFERLHSLGYTTNPLIEYVRLPENIGGAGGFHEGVKKAYEAGYEWIWMMDDDVRPRPDCLTIMLDYKTISDCIHPRRYHGNFEYIKWGGYIDFRSGFDIHVDDYLSNKDWAVVNFGCFEGMLIRKNIVQKIGFPRKEFFLYGDDSEYGFLASKYTNCLYLRNALMERLIVPDGPTSPLQFFLFYRNYVGFLARKRSKSRISYAVLAAYALLRSSASQLVQLSPIGLFSIWFGFICGILGRWGDEKKYLTHKIAAPTHSIIIYKCLKRIKRGLSRL